MQQAFTAYEADKGKATCALLAAFVTTVKAQSGNKFDEATARRLIADAQEIQVAVDC
jgi:hypothetical protein